MPVFDVTLTVKAFKHLPDDSQVAIERLVFHKAGIVAATKEAALIVAGGQVDATPENTDEVLGQSIVTVKG